MEIEDENVDCGARKLLQLWMKSLTYQILLYYKLEMSKENLFVGEYHLSVQFQFFFIFSKKNIGFIWFS